MVKRYSLNVPCELRRQRGEEAEMFEIAAGAYVRHEDYQVLLAVVEAAKETLTRIVVHEESCDRGDAFTATEARAAISQMGKGDSQ